MESKKKKNNKRVRVGSRLFEFVFPWGKRPTVKTVSRINSKYIAWLAMSIASGFIDFIFFCNMTKSKFEIGTLFSIPAAIVYGYISICLTYSKALHSIEINALNQIRRYLDKTTTIAKTFFKVTTKWVVIYILYILISIMTSASLSTISIGEGIHRNQSVIKSINSDISKLQKYYNTEEKSDSLQFENIVSNVNISAEKIARDTFNSIRPIIEEYRQERTDFEELGISFDFKEEIEWNGKKIIPDSYWDSRNKKVVSDLATKGVSLTTTQIRKAGYTEIQAAIKKKQEELNSNKGMKDLESLTQMTKSKYVQAIKNLENKYKDPSGNYIIFDENNLDGAISKLENLRVSYENDSGDIGSSAKIFMQIGSSFSSKKEDKDLMEIAKETVTLTSFGPTEKLMIAVLFFFGLLLELGINQFAPTGELTRKGLGQFRKYFPKEFNVSDFMFEIAKKKLEFGDITEEEFLKEKKECEDIKRISSMKLEDEVLNTEQLKKELEQKNSDNEKLLKELTDARNKLFKLNLNKKVEISNVESKEETKETLRRLSQKKEEVKEIAKEAPKAETKETIKKEPKIEEPKIETKELKPSRKLVVLPAEVELENMINN